MRIGILALFLAASVSLVSCNKTEFQFGQPYESGSMHDDLGNLRENTQLDPLVPISGNCEPSAVPLEKELVKTAEQKPKQRINVHNPTSVTKETQAIATEPARASLDWQPNEALVIRGQEILQGLERELKSTPTQVQMSQRLQTHMGLSELEALKLISLLRTQ